jgi:mono/diheme cytochrome c family protein
MRRYLLAGVAVLAVAFLAIQLVPYGRDHANPPVIAEPAWDSPTTRQLAVAACFDCHSNETVWPWYSNIAPISWRLQNHVTEGRDVLNFSEWGTGEQETDEIVEVVREGEMPPWDYLLSHAEARLSAADTQTLIDGLGATFGAGEGEQEDED